jgi:hypothetical protein
MKMKTTQIVSVTNEEVIRYLTKVVEKKTGKKVVKVTEPFDFHLQDEEADLDKEQA